MPAKRAGSLFHAALIHGIANTGQIDAVATATTIMGNQRQHPVKPSNRVKQLRHHAANGPGEGEPVALYIIHQIHAEASQRAARLQFICH